MNENFTNEPSQIFKLDDKLELPKNLIKFLYIKTGTAQEFN